ncbi:hypothetical protein [Candidatus Binatus sp.]|uniref:hypothetical protein n=1 Tax=Candidatus Binatus sp. TaxID=2811406 RepID=UPI002F95D74F
MGRRFLQYLSALNHYILLIAGSAIFLLPTVVEYFWPHTQGTIDPFLSHLNANQHVRALGGGLLLFWATFLAWKKERDAREKESPQALKKEIEKLQKSQADLASMFWRRMRDDEKVALKENLLKIGKHSVRFISVKQTDCIELIGDLRQAFMAAGWTLDLPPQRIESLDRDRELVTMNSGIHILGKYPDQTGLKVSEALSQLVKGDSVTLQPWTRVR